MFRLSAASTILLRIARKNPSIIASLAPCRRPSCQPDSNAALIPLVDWRIVVDDVSNCCGKILLLSLPLSLHVTGSSDKLGCFGLHVPQYMYVDCLCSNSRLEIGPLPPVSGWLGVVTIGRWSLLDANLCRANLSEATITVCDRILAARRRPYRGAL